jgi:hypothetical protein
MRGARSLVEGRRLVATVHTLDAQPLGTARAYIRTYYVFTGSYPLQSRLVI